MMLGHNKLYFSYLFVLSVISVVPFHIFNLFNKNQFKAESSIWCTKGSNNSNLCRFTNICYDANVKSFIFFLGERSVIKGLQHYSELQKIQLSSIVDHNQFFANISVVDINNYRLPKNINIESKSYLLSRFKPNNLMHVIHDDIFPLFLTLEYLCLGNLNCMNTFRLVFHDSYPPGPYSEFYDQLSRHSPIFLNNQSANGYSFLCFQEISTGLVQDGIFYQYGFKKPQGPVANPLLNYNDVIRFSEFLKKKLNVNKKSNNKTDIVIISRSKTRRIINIDAFVKMVTDTYKSVYKKDDVNIVILDLLSTSIQHFLNVVSECQLLTGMHGAEMIFGLFTKPDTYVIELFPFGIQPDYVSFVKPISNLKTSHLLYFSWKNNNKSNSVAHPDAHPLFGGIRHLDGKTQWKISNTQVVPAVTCCSNPIYLYHMYQDTWVGSEFQTFLESSLSLLPTSKDSNLSGLVEDWFHPYVPVNVTCEFHQTRQLHISWWPPFNVNNSKELEYNLFVEDYKNQFEKSFLTFSLKLSILIPSEVKEACPQFRVWISVLYKRNMSKSKNSHFSCLCT